MTYDITKYVYCPNCGKVCERITTGKTKGKTFCEDCQVYFEAKIIGTAKEGVWE